MGNLPVVLFIPSIGIPARADCMPPEDIAKLKDYCIAQSELHGCRVILVLWAKLRNNADVQKQFWKINAVRPINKGNSRDKKGERVTFSWYFGLRCLHR